MFGTRSTEVECTHCGGRGYHGTGAIFDEETRESFPTDCGCCGGRGYHPTYDDEPGARDYPCFS